MAIFNKTDGRAVSTSETTIIAKGTKVEGSFECTSRLHIDGAINGQVHSKNIVTIGKDGSISGAIVANRLIINGLFEGNADCETIEVLAGGKLLGQIISKELIIEAKAFFEGESKIKTDSEPVIAIEKKKDK